MSRDAQYLWMRATARLFGGQEDDAPSPTAAVGDPSLQPFELRESFFTRPEAALFGRLREAVGSRAIVCPKTRVLDVLRLPNASQRLDDAVRLDRKFIDFLVCHPLTSRPLCAVQLDRWDADRQRYGLRDEFLEQALASAGMVVLHVPSESIPHRDLIAEELFPLLDGPPIPGSAEQSSVEEQRSIEEPGDPGRRRHVHPR